MKTLLDRDELVLNPPELGCALYLPGLPGGGSKIHDRSPYANSGTIAGATWRRLPSGLWYLDFDGTDDYATIPHSDSVSFSGTEMTAIAWICPGAWGNDGTILRKGSYGAVGTTGYFLDINDGTEFRAQLYGVTGGSATHSVSGCDLNVWIRLAVVYDGSKLSFFVNKGRMTYQDATGNVATNSADLLIGSEAPSDDQFQGGIALVRLYNRAVSRSALDQGYQREKHLFGAW